VGVTKKTSKAYGNYLLMRLPKNLKDMREVALIASILFTHMVHGQAKDPFPYKFSSSIYEEIKSDSNSWRGGVTSSDLSFIGLYKEALEEWDKIHTDTKTISKADSIDFIKTYKPTDAKDFILQKAKENRVLIFNEAHYNPRHRVFVTSLLKDLEELGFTYFAAETFSNRADFHESSKYPNLNSGYYAMEPQFGNLIREANKLNYTLYPYESTSRGNLKDRKSSIRAREIGQAKNLAKLLDSVPNSKLIIYCGFSHIVEDSIPGFGVPMAARLKEFTGIDPYTIDQIVLSERFVDSLNDPYFRMINEKKYSILVDKQKNGFNRRNDGRKVDALLFSPPTTYLHNRPDWVFENGKRPFILSKDSVRVSYPFIAKIYFNESDIGNLAIPIDIIEIKNEQSLASTALVVFKDKDFIIQLFDTRGKTQIIQPKNKRD
jgi:hypothetical protein